ncbi:malectin isoform X2 [Mus pahari]|uniref:malectin isoform X2 n=1 Tax=Mus pahari TaxID=10093 RepID=UPI001114AFCB|nr:malectin isoform X2 [Mus pahari]
MACPPYRSPTAFRAPSKPGTGALIFSQNGRESSKGDSPRKFDCGTPPLPSFGIRMLKRRCRCPYIAAHPAHEVNLSSDYGMKLPILRSTPEDQILYQTERYNEETFGYEVPVKEEGDYVLVLKFAEVYFAQSQQKVFDVRLNGHVVVKDLDIFDRVGHSTAHDEIIPMSIRKGKLSVQGEVSTFTGKLYIEFVKGYYDNPKVCALYILAGTVDDVPKLQPHPGLEKKEEEEEEEEYDEGSSLKRQTNKNRVQSGPRTPNPYASDNSSLMFPILVAFGVFIPTLFCLCRL